MTHDTKLLSNIRPYIRPLHIHTADGNPLPISTVGDVSPELSNVLLYPRLSTNLFSVDQLVDNNCTVSFSSSGCLVQDQVSGRTIMRGPKDGRLFPILPKHVPFFPIVCNYATFNIFHWHKLLGHPNSNVLHQLLNSGW